MDDVSGLYIEDNGVISIAGADFHRKRETDDIKMQVIDNLGIEDKSVMMGDPTAKVRNPRDRIDDGPVTLPSSSAPEYTQAWLDNVLRNAAVNKSTFFIDKPERMRSTPVRRT